jgi:hypothetical protein
MMNTAEELVMEIGRLTRDVDTWKRIAKETENSAMKWADRALEAERKLAEREQRVLLGYRVQNMNTKMYVTPSGFQAEKPRPLTNNEAMTAWGNHCGYDTRVPVRVTPVFRRSR